MRIKRFCKRRHDTFKVGRRKHGQCNKCAQMSGKEFYRNNIVRLKEYAKNWTQTNRKLCRSYSAKSKAKIFIDIILAYKTLPCIDCKEMYHPVCMEFDHLPKFKKTGGVNNFNSKIKTLREIQKCQLVCANCHNIRTWKRGQSHHKFIKYDKTLDKRQKICYN